MQKFTCLNLFHGSHFHVLVVGHENRKNLDLAKISHYTVVHCFSAPLEKTWVVTNIFLGKCASIILMDIIKWKKTTPSNLAKAGFEIIQ